MEDVSPLSKADIESNLLSHIAHDLRGSFNGLIGFSDLLETNYDAFSDDQKKEYVHLIKSLSFKSFLSTLTVITWIRSISNNLKINQSIFSFSDLGKSVEQFCESSLENKKNTFEVTSSPSVFVNGDIHHLSIALANLVNYLQSMTEPQSTISLQAFQQSVDKITISISFLATSEAKTLPQMDILRNFLTSSIPENILPLWVAANLMAAHNATAIVTEDNQLITMAISL